MSTLIQQARLEAAELWATARYARLILMIVALAVLARIGVALIFADLNPATANIWEYGTSAITALKHGALVGEALRPDGSIYVFPTGFMPPLSIFLWMGIFKVLGVSKAALMTMIAINIVCGGAIAYYTARIAKTLFHSSVIALAAGAIAALHPVFVFSAATYHAVNLYVLLLLILFDLSSSQRPFTLGRSIATGLVLGAAILIRTEYLILGAAILFGAWLAHRRFLLAALSLVVAACIVAPWTIRNYMVFDRLIPVANSSGYNLFKGFNPRANGSGDWVDNHKVAQDLLGADLARVPFTPHYELDLDDVYRASAEQFIASDPVAAFVTLPIQKVLLFWFFDIHDPSTHGWAYQLSLWPLLILAVIGFVYACRAGFMRNADHRTVAILFGAQTLVMAAYAVHMRYKMNIEPFLFGYAALGALWLWSKRFKASFAARPHPSLN